MITTRAEAEQQIVRDLETSGATPASFNIAAIADACHAITGDWRFDSIDDDAYEQVVQRHASFIDHTKDHGYWLHRCCDSLDVIDLNDLSTASLAAVTAVLEAVQQTASTTRDMRYWDKRCAAALIALEHRNMTADQLAALAIIAESFVPQPRLRLVGSDE